jgi:hypothetical protein
MSVRTLAQIGEPHGSGSDRSIGNLHIQLHDRAFRVGERRANVGQSSKPVRPDTRRMRMRMRKLMILPGIALAALALGAAGGSAPASAANNYHFGASASHLPRNVLEDDVVDDDEDDDEEDTTFPSESGGGASAESGSGSGDLPLTGGNASALAMLGATALATGVAMHRVSKRRAGLALETAD